MARWMSLGAVSAGWISRPVKPRSSSNSSRSKGLATATVRMPSSRGSGGAAGGAAPRLLLEQPRALAGLAREGQAEPVLAQDLLGDQHLGDELEGEVGGAVVVRRDPHGRLAVAGQA